jgi:hypothetical protein
LTANDRTQSIGYLSMPGHRYLLSIGRIAVDIATLAVPAEHAPGGRQLADKCSPLHTSNSTGSRWALDGAGRRSWVTIIS